MSSDQQYYNQTQCTCDGIVEVHVCTKERIDEADVLKIQVLNFEDHLVHEFIVKSDKVILTGGGE